MEREFVGIDVSQDSLSFALYPDGQKGKFPNTEGGRAKLITQLRKRRATLVVVEASGGTERALVWSLTQAGIAVAVVNPQQVRASSAPWGGWPKRTPSTPRSWYGSRKH